MARGGVDDDAHQSLLLQVPLVEEVVGLAPRRLVDLPFLTPLGHLWIVRGHSWPAATRSLSQSGRARGLAVIDVLGHTHARPFRG